jgi:two-component system chemotaxis response regulator CheB
LKKVILIGASTGGPSIIKEILSQIKHLSSTIIVVQHMKEEVLPFFINDLRNSLKIKVQTTPLDNVFSEPSVIVCSHSCVLKKKNSTYYIETDIQNQEYTPDINKFFNSFLDYSDGFNIEVMILTGIGSDGVDASESLKRKGAKIIAQAQEGCPVFGMPKAAIDRGIADEIKTIEEIKEYFGDSV